MTPNLPKAFRRARHLGEILSSVAVAEELNDVFGREKFDRYITREDRERFLVTFVQAATLVEIVDRIVACRDPKDDKFLELAVSGNAKCIVTADDDLLVLHPFREIPILSVEQFVSPKEERVWRDRS